MKDKELKLEETEASHTLGVVFKYTYIHFMFVYYESIKRELNKRLIFDSRCDARLKAKADGMRDVHAWHTLCGARNRNA